MKPRIKLLDDDELVENELAIQILLELYEHVSTHPIRTVETFRNTLLGDGMFAINPMLDVPSKIQVSFLLEIIRRGVREGRMIDFGFIPNEIIKETSYATREVYSAGELQHPYDNWMGVSAWEGGMCGYFFAPMLEPNRVLCTEMYGIAIPNKPAAIIVNDIVSLEAVGPDVRIQPWRMIDPLHGLETEQAMANRGSNLLDPLVTFLRLLADASVPIIDGPAPERLNKRQVRQGKWPIPAHTRVETRDYVSSGPAAVHRCETSGPR